MATNSCYGLSFPSTTRQKIGSLITLVVFKDKPPTSIHYAAMEQGFSSAGVLSSQNNGKELPLVGVMICAHDQQI